MISPWMSGFLGMPLRSSPAVTEAQGLANTILLPSHLAVEESEAGDCHREWVGEPQPYPTMAG